MDFMFSFNKQVLHILLELCSDNDPSTLVITSIIHVSQCLLGLSDALAYVSKYL